MRKALILAAVIGAVLAAPLAIYAADRFKDVPDGHTFHDAISWMADKGITTGCNPSANDRYCPDKPVTRGQMAGFMKRFHNTFIGDNSSAIGLGIAVRGEDEAPDPGNGVVDGLTLSLNIPEAGVLVITGNVQMINEEDSDAFLCGVNLGGAPTTAQVGSWRIVDLLNTNASICATTAAVGVTPGNLTARLVVAESIPSSYALQGTLQAVLYTGDGAMALQASPNEAKPAPSVTDELKTSKG